MGSLGVGVFKRGYWGKHALQWGHDSSAVDTRRRGLDIRVVIGLQWGHDSSAVDTAEILIKRNTDMRLQWGHDSSAVDTCACDSASQRACLFNGVSSMGPRLFSRGYIEDAHLCVSDPWTLQWGHDSSAVDTCAEVISCDACHILQWGHDSSAVDTGGSDLGAGRARGSSMGPRLFSRGYPHVWTSPEEIGASSMGPRLFSRGYFGIDGRLVSEKRILQWGHDSSAVDTSRMREMKSRDVVFNGATTLQPWIQRMLAICRIRLISSMGPRLFSRGYPIQDKELTTVRPSSMGPRLFSRGYFSKHYDVGHQSISLQWGHDSSAVDTLAGGCDTELRACLQWGHDSSAVDT